MTARELRHRGFAVRIEVPDRVAARLRGAARLRDRGRASGGGVGTTTAGDRAAAVQQVPLPAVQPEAREPQRALDFLRDPALAGDGLTPSPKLQEYLAEVTERQQAATTLAQRVEAHPWYHAIDLPGGITTPGSHDLRAVVPLVGLPDRLDGLRALDVATYDGFWAFELERRGAEVTAIDIPAVHDLDWPTGVDDIVQAEALDVPVGQPFQLAAETLESSVKRLGLSVYDLDPATVGHFDLVFVGDLLLHLARPLDALRAVRRVTRGQLVLMDRFDPSISGTGRRLLRYEGGWTALEWWAPSLEALTQMVVDAGFGDVTHHTGLSIPNKASGGYAWPRVVIHARP